MGGLGSRGRGPRGLIIIKERCVYLSLPVQARQELQLLRFERKEHAQEAAAFLDELPAPRFDLRLSRCQIGSQHGNKLLLDFPGISRYCLDLDRSPISPTRSPVYDKAQAQPCRITAHVTQS